MSFAASISPEELRHLRTVDPAVVVVDARDAEELDGGFISGSVHIPHLQMAQYAPMVLPNKNVTIVVFCATGRRSASAAKELRELGYADVRNLEGGFEAWSLDEITP